MAAENLVALSAEQFNNLQFPSLLGSVNNNGSIDAAPPPASWLNQLAEVVKVGTDVYKDVMSTIEPKVYDANGKIIIPDNAIIQKEKDAALTAAATAVAKNQMVTNSIGIVLLVGGAIALFFLLRK